MKLSEELHSIGNLHVTRVSAELKMARSLVRVADIQATLQEQRYNRAVTIWKKSHIDIDVVFKGYSFSDSKWRNWKNWSRPIILCQIKKFSLAEGQVMRCSSSLVYMKVVLLSRNRFVFALGGFIFRVSFEAKQNEKKPSAKSHFGRKPTQSRYAGVWMQSKNATGYIRKETLNILFALVYVRLCISSVA